MLRRLVAGGAGISEVSQPGRICVRPRLGRRVGGSGRSLVSEASGRCAVHAGPGAAAAGYASAAAARGDRNRHRAECAFVGPHHLHRQYRMLRDSQQRGWLMRHGDQYHWLNRDYGGFDDFLATLSSRKRKTLRKERSAAVEGLESPNAARARRSAPRRIGMRCGPIIRTPDCGKWGRPYLTREFFDLVAERMSNSLLLFLACRAGCTDCRRAQLHRAGHALWPLLGGVEEVPFLHFELCYYQRHRMGDRPQAERGPGRGARGA